MNCPEDLISLQDLPGFDFMCRGAGGVRCSAAC